MNVFQATVAAAESAQQVKIRATLFFNHLLADLIRNLPQDFVQSYHMKLFSFFKKACFILPYKVHKSFSVEIDGLDSMIAEAFSALVVKLNEDQLRVMVSKITKWGLNKDQDLKKLMMFELFNSVISKLKEFFVPLVHIYFHNAILPSLEYCSN